MIIQFSSDSSAIIRHEHLIGKICKLSERGVQLEYEYEKIFGIGNGDHARLNHFLCHMGGRYEMSLMFIGEQPYIKNGVVWYCVKEIGEGVLGDWYWYTLNQLVICEEKIK